MIKTTLFLGIHFDKTLKHAAYTSDTFKLAEISWQSQDNGPKFLTHGDKEFFAIEAPSDYSAIQALSKTLSLELLKHFSGLDHKDLNVYLFPLVSVT